MVTVGYTPYGTSWTDPESPMREYKVVTHPGVICNQIPTLITSSGSLLVVDTTYTTKLHTAVDKYTVNGELYVRTIDNE